MGFMESLLGGTDTEEAPTITKTQKAFLDATMKWLQARIGEGAEPFPGDLTVDVPDLFSQAYDWYEGQFGRGDISSAITDMIAGAPAYTYKPGEVTKEWQKDFASPVMQAWQNTVLPMVRESYNIPGVAYSRSRAEGTTRAAGDFYGQFVAPTLFQAQQTGRQMGFQSAEAAAARRPGALQLPFQQFLQGAGAAESYMRMFQPELTAEYQEFLRTRAEPGWAVAAGLPSATQQTMENWLVETPGILDAISGIGNAAVGMFAPGTGAFAQLGFDK